MPRPALEVADIFRDHGAAWRRANAGHVSLEQLKVMSAIERCRTVALGGHVARCEDCADTIIAYNSCRNRHCPKCQGAAAKEWLAERQAELLPVGYFHLVFTLPGPIVRRRSSSLWSASSSPASEDLHRSRHPVLRRSAFGSAAAKPIKKATVAIRWIVLRAYQRFVSQAARTLNDLT